MEIVKADGSVMKFDPKAIVNSIVRAGGKPKYAKEVAGTVEKKVKNGIRSEDVLDLTLSCMINNPVLAARYDLKRAIMELGPSGFAFEEYFGQILKHYGYKTQVGMTIKGEVVSQEIDVIARSDDGKRIAMIEAKYHNSTGIRSDTKVAMYTYARFLDVKHNKKFGFNEAWLVTNTKCTNNARRYASGVDLKIIAWRYPKTGNLQEMIEKKGLYPITILRKLEKGVKEKLFSAKIVMAADMMKYSLDELVAKTHLKKGQLERIMHEAKSICGLS
ncbi:MAG: hypothetical protein ACI83O_000843 [Patescibacteria group bacterium]|jgi:hypothetical protein